MKQNKHDIKILFFLFVISFLSSWIIFFVSIPLYSYISYSKIKNIYNGTYIKNNLFPDFTIYNTNQNKNVSYLLNENGTSMIAIQGCSCKDKELNNWMNESTLNGIPFIYLYTNEDDFCKDKFLKNKANVSIYMCSMSDIVSFFPNRDISDFPVLYIVNSNGVIIDEKR